MTSGEETGSGNFTIDTYSSWYKKHVVSLFVPFLRRLATCVFAGTFIIAITTTKGTRPSPRSHEHWPKQKQKAIMIMMIMMTTMMMIMIIIVVTITLVVMISREETGSGGPSRKTDPAGANLSATHRLPDGVGTNGVVAEVPRLPLMNFHGKMSATCEQILQNVVRKCSKHVAKCGEMWQHVRT